MNNSRSSIRSIPAPLSGNGSGELRGAILVDTKPLRVLEHSF